MTDEPSHAEKLSDVHISGANFGAKQRVSVTQNSPAGEGGRRLEAKSGMMYWAVSPGGEMRRQAAEYITAPSTARSLWHDASIFTKLSKQLPAQPLALILQVTAGISQN